MPSDAINDQGETICGTCGRVIRSWMWPFCPHPNKSSEKREDGKSTYVPDEIPGGLTLENVGPEPVTVYSYTEMNQLFASRGLTRAERFCPTPGTATDPAGVQDSRKYMDPYTLANGAELILRAAGARGKEAEDKAFAERAYRPLPDRVLDKAEAAMVIRETERAKKR